MKVIVCISCAFGACAGKEAVKGQSKQRRAETGWHSRDWAREQQTSLATPKEILQWVEEAHSYQNRRSTPKDLGPTWAMEYWQQIWRNFKKLLTLKVPDARGL